MKHGFSSAKAAKKTKEYFPSRISPPSRDIKNLADNATKRARLKVRMKSKITTLVLLTVLFLTGCGRHSVTAPVKNSAEIDRKTFSMSLPEGWTEDTKDDMYDPDSFVFFENSESCLFCVFIGEKSAGLTIDAVLEEQKKSYQKKLTEFTTSTFNSWSKYQWKGVEITGKMSGAIKYRSRLFGFENGDNVCVVTEAATPADLKAYAGDFETIRQSFILK